MAAAVLFGMMAMHYLRKILTRLRELVYSDPEPIEFWQGVIGALWGLWLLLVDPFPTSVSFNLMARMTHGNDTPWGVLILTFHLLQLIALGLDQRTRRMALCGCNAFIWFVVWGSIVLSNWETTGTIWYGGYWLAFVWVCWRHNAARKAGQRRALDQRGHHEANQLG